MADKVTTSWRNLSSQAAARWDSIANEVELHLSAHWLRSVEGNLEMSPLYLVRTGAGGEIHGAAVGYLMDDTPQSRADSLIKLSRVDFLLGGLLAGELGRSAGTAAVLRRLLPSLSCGGWTHANSDIVLSAGLCRRDRRAVAAQVVGGLVEAAADVGARSVCFPYVEERNQDLQELLIANEFVQFPAASHYAIDVTWRSFDDYLLHFPGPRRVKIRREYRRLKEAGVTFRTQRLDEPLARGLLPLAMGTVRKHQGAISEKSLYDRLRLLVEVGSEVVLLEHDETVKGFGVVIEWRDQLYARMCGFDYASQGRLPLYFGLMYEQVRHAIERGLRRIEYGVAIEEAKMSRGARRFPQYSYVKALARADHALVADAIRRVTEQSSAEYPATNAS
jgi:predicted N-acyltransferase